MEDISTEGSALEAVIEAVPTEEVAVDNSKEVLLAEARNEVDRYTEVVDRANTHVAEANALLEAARARLTSLEEV